MNPEIEANLRMLEDEPNRSGALPFPPIVCAPQFLEDQASLEEPRILIKGLLRRGDKGVYAGGSKSCKTWMLSAMALAVADGSPFLGMHTSKSKVLYINLEMSDYDFHRRWKAILDGRPAPVNLEFLNLRGAVRPIEMLNDELFEDTYRERIKSYDLIILDPIYKLLGERRENEAGDMTNFMNHLDELSVLADAAIMFGAHFPKGNQSSRDHLDRISGSGVIVRDPDLIITATNHKEEDCLSLEMTARNLARPKPVVVRWNYPHFDLTELDPADLAQRPTAAKTKNDKAAMIALLPPEGLRASEWQKKGADIGIAKSSFYNHKKTLVKGGLVEQREKLFFNSKLSSSNERDPQTESFASGAPEVN